MFTIATYNVHYGKKIQKIPAAFSAHPHLQSAHILLFQEIEYHDTAEKAQAKHIADELGFEYRYAPARDLATGGTHGIALLSKYPILEYEVIRLPYFHTSYRTRERIAQLALLDVGGTPVLICNVHLDVRVNLMERITQLKPVLLQLSQYQTERIIIAGDFNTTPMLWYKRAVPVLVRNQQKGFRFFMEELGFTATPQKRGHSFRAGPIPLHLDEIYVRGLTIEEAGVANTIRLSDHKPLWARISMSATSQ